jgi:hydrogenase maturation protein HypF
LSESTGIDTIVLSGGVFQNDLLLQDLKSLLDEEGLRVWTNRTVPANDGGISLGQAALAAFQQGGQEHA